YAEIQHLHAHSTITLASQEQIVGLEIAVHDAMLMSFLDCVARSNHHVQGTLHAEGALRAQQLAEVRAIEQLGDHERSAAVDAADVEHMSNVLPLQMRNHLSLLQKASNGFLTIGVLLPQYFHRNRLIQQDMP